MAGNAPAKPLGVARAGWAGIWDRVRHGLERLASHLEGEVVAKGMPGEMTGISREDKAKAAKKGEYFPLYEFSIPREAVEQLQRAQEPVEPGGAGQGPQERPAPHEGK